MGDYLASQRLHKAMGDMAYSLERDPQVDSLLRARRHELGLTGPGGEGGVGRELIHTLGLGRGCGLSI